jgi:hypothetical protein
MEDQGRQFLEQQVEAADIALNDAVQAFYHALDNVDRRFKDAASFRGALQAYTRDSDNPYQPAPLVNPLENLLAERQTEGTKEEARKTGDSRQTAQTNRAKRGEELPSPNSKVGVALRILMNSNGNGLRMTH